MTDKAYRIHTMRVEIRTYSDGTASGVVLACLRSGEFHEVFRQDWLSGAPTPHQLDLLRAEVDDELQALVLMILGVQGVLLSEG